MCTSSVAWDFPLWPHSQFNSRIKQWEFQFIGTIWSDMLIRCTCAWEADSVTLKKPSPCQVREVCRGGQEGITHVRAHTWTHTELAIVKRRPAVCLFSQTSPSSRSDPSTGFPAHPDPWALEGMLAPWPCCATGTGVLLHRLGIWRKKKRQKLGHKLKLKELLESLCCRPDKFY